MKTLFTKSIAVATFFSVLTARATEPVVTQKITFTENKGQICDQNFKPRPDVLFSGLANGMVYHLTKDGISYQLNKVESWKEITEFKSNTKLKVANATSIYRVDVKWVGINKNAQIEKGEVLDGVENYYLQQCPEGALNVNRYSQLTYKNIYNGIDLKWYEKNGQLEYDFILKPNADPSQIKIKIDGAQQIKLNSKGELEFSTPFGTIIEKAPIAYQGTKSVNAKWILKNDDISFEVTNYDKNLPLIIDPVVRLWGTYYGGAGDEHMRDVTLDAAGNSYVAGYSSSTAAGTLIATTGSHQTTHAGGTFDAFMIKFNPAGVRQWATFYGGAGDDFGVSNSIDGVATPGVYLAGYTNSSTGTVIATVGSHQSTNSGLNDVFLVKFNSSTGVRQWGTYYGNTGNDYGYSCETDGLNNVIVVGTTSTAATSTLIATAGAHQTTYGGNGSDGFIAKFNSSGVRQWSTYFGGNGLEDIYGCDVSKTTNDIAITGRNCCGTGLAGIATTGAFQAANSAVLDGFIAKFNQSGVQQWGTFYGGAGNEYFQSCAINSLGEVYALGTLSTVGMATAGSHQGGPGGGGQPDAFLTKFGSTGTRLWATYYGGSGAEEGMACSLDNAGNVYIAGNTLSTGNIATAGSHQIAYAGGAIDDAFIASFTPAGVRLFGSYYGGSVEDLSWSCKPDASGNVYLVGSTQTTTGGIISTPSSHQSTHGGGTYDGYLVKFFACQNLTLTITGASVLCSGSTATLSASGTGFTTYTWSTGPTTTSIAVSPTTNTTYTLTASSPTAVCVYTDTQTITVNPTPTVNVVVFSPTICTGFSSTLTVGGTPTYTWSTGSTANAVAVSPTVTTTYSVTGTAANSCTDTKTVLVTVNPTPTVNVVPSSSTVCAGSSASLTASGASTYSWSTGATTTVIAVSPTITTVYTATGTTAAGCKDTQTLSIGVVANPTVGVSASSASVCSGSTAMLTASGASTYTWSTGGTGGSIAVNPTITTVYTATGTAASSCKDTQTISVAVNPSPTVAATSSSSVICTGSSATLSATGAVSYSWNPGSLTGTSVAVAPTLSTTYTVVGASSFGCTTTRTVSITVSACTGINEARSTNGTINIYPNPNNGEFNLIVPEQGTYVIINGIGQTVETLNVKEDSQTISVQGLADGIYYVIGKTSKAKIVVSK